MGFFGNVADGAARIYDGFATVYEKGLKTNAAELAGGIAKGDYMRLVNKSGFNNAVVAQAHSVAKSQGVALGSEITSAMRAGNFAKAQEMASGNSALSGIISSSQEEVLARRNALKNLMKFDDKGAITGVDGALADTAYSIGREGSFVDSARYYSKAPMAYFTEPGKQKQRMIAGAAAYAAGSVGVRLLDGGSLTRNSKGEKDIAGVPFF
jgi:hypothetical protein